MYSSSGFKHALPVDYLAVHGSIIWTGVHMGRPVSFAVALQFTAWRIPIEVRACECYPPVQAARWAQ